MLLLLGWAARVKRVLVAVVGSIRAGSLLVGALTGFPLGRSLLLLFFRVLQGFRGFLEPHLELLHLDSLPGGRVEEIYRSAARLVSRERQVREEALQVVQVGHFYGGVEAPLFLRRNVIFSEHLVGRIHLGQAL